MQRELTRYLFIGDFDSLLLGLFSKRGEVIWVSSLEEALNQTGNFSVIMIEKKTFSSDISKKLSIHYPQTPIIVSNGDRPDEPPPSVRFVPFHKILTSEIAREERLAKTELRVEELRRVHGEAKKMLILLHDHPDPDSIASALALRTLLKRNRQTALIGHLGERISRPENVAMIELLEIDLEELDCEHADVVQGIHQDCADPLRLGLWRTDGRRPRDAQDSVPVHVLADRPEARLAVLRPPADDRELAVEVDELLGDLAVGERLVELDAALALAVVPEAAGLHERR